MDVVLDLLGNADLHLDGTAAGMFFNISQGSVFLRTDTSSSDTVIHIIIPGYHTVTCVMV